MRDPTTCNELDERNCSLNDGIRNYCNQCALNGFRLTKEGQCQLIPFCEISNGQDTCVACEKNHIVNEQGGCVEIEKKITHCEVYSYQKIKKELVSNYISLEEKLDLSSELN